MFGSVMQNHYLCTEEEHNYCNAIRCEDEVSTDTEGCWREESALLLLAVPDVLCSSHIPCLAVWE